MDRPLRFLYATAEPHPTWRADVITLFGKYLPQFGVRTDLLAVREDPKKDTAWPAGELFVRDGGSSVKNLIADVLLQLSLFRRAFAGYDGIVVRDKPILALIGYLAARLARLPFIYWMSFPMPESYMALANDDSGRISRLRRTYLRVRSAIGSLILYRFLMHRADWVFAQSDTMVQDLRRMGLGHMRVSAVPMGVDIEALPQGKDSVVSELAGSQCAIYMGTLDRYRKPEILVDLAPLVAAHFPNFKLLIVGEADEPTDRGWLQEYAKSRGAMPWLQFTGRVPHAQALLLAQSACVGLSPLAPSKLTESTSPTKPLEYMALGLPIVCNNLPDQARIIAASQAGWCVEFSAQEFASAILQCLRNPEQAAQMAQRGRNWVQANRSYRSLAKQVAATLRQITA